MIKEEPVDRLEDEWLKLGALIKQREAELSALKRNFEILDNARAVLIQGSAANNLNAHHRLPKLGLRAAVLLVVQESEFGVPLSSLCDAVSKKIEVTRYSSARSLHAAVITTARRLVTDSELKIIAVGGKPSYILGAQAVHAETSRPSGDTEEGAA